MTYHDSDSGLDFASYDDYRLAREGQPAPTDDELCASEGHRYAGDDNGVGRCWCGAQMYPEGGEVDE